MKKSDLAKRLAKQSHLTRAAAADQVDRIVHELLNRIRKGESATLPGLGTFSSGKESEFGSVKNGFIKKKKKKTK